MSKEEKGKKFGRLYLESFKREVVVEAEFEGSLALVCARHGISTRTIQNWMKLYGSSSYHQNRKKKRSLSERDGIAREIVWGHISVEDAMLKYKLEYRDTVTLWVRSYKRRQQELLAPLLMGSLPGEIGTPSADGSTADLKLAELKIRALETMLDIASKEFQVDIRKKFGAKQ